MPDLPESFRTIDDGSFVQLRVYAGECSDIDNGAVAEVLPYRREIHHRIEELFQVQVKDWIQVRGASTLIDEPVHGQKLIQYRQDDYP